MPLSYETARNEVFCDPLNMLSQGEYLLRDLGVRLLPEEDPEQYLVDVHHQDPRYRDRFGNKREEVLSRQEVAARSHSITDDDEIRPIYDTAGLLGIMVPEYPFDDFAQSVDAVLVTAGVKTAIEDRAVFAASLGAPEFTFVVGGDRPVSPVEKDQLANQNEQPDNFKTESDIARWVTERLDLRFFEPQSTNPDNLDVITEFLLRERVGQLALVTTQLYVPFTTADAGTATTAVTAGTLPYRVYAGASDPEKVKARPVDIYRSEVMRTLFGAARWYREQVRRKLR